MIIFHIGVIYENVYVLHCGMIYDYMYCGMVYDYMYITMQYIYILIYDTNVKDNHTSNHNPYTLQAKGV